MSDQIALEFAPDRERDIERLIPLARQLAAAAGTNGITVANLRIAAVNASILTGQESGKRLSYLGVVMKKAGLVPIAEYRRSHIDRSHGNLHRVFVASEYSNDRRAAS